MTTTPRKTKTATSKSSPTEAAAPTEAEAPADAAPAAASQDVLKLKDLVATVAKTTGERPAAVKRTVEATLQALGSALHAGRGANLPGLGKAKVSRSVAGKPLTIKLKAGAEKLPQMSAQDALAEDED